MSDFKVSVNGLAAEVQMFKFSGGETQVTFKNPSTSSKDCLVRVFAYITDGDIMPLALLVDAIRRTISNPTIELLMPYLPYARQDRVMNPGEALAVKVFADMVNSLNLDSVIVCDCHSDVGIALLNNAKNDQTLDDEFFTPKKHWDVIVAPDAGALKKTLKYAKTLGIGTLIRADKTRNVVTGEITGTEVYGDVFGKDVLIIDDICDGGRTFIELAKVLNEKGASKITLHVTHGIFSKGKEVFDGIIDEVHAEWDWTVIN